MRSRPRKPHLEHYAHCIPGAAQVRRIMNSGRSVLGASETDIPYHAGGSELHVLTLTPFFPSLEDEVSGCFVAEPNRMVKRFGVSPSVIGVSPVYSSPKKNSISSPADWVRYPQLPGTLGMSSAGWGLYGRLRGKVSRLHRESPIDLIHAHAALPCGHAAALLSRHLNIPFVVTVHGLDVFNTCLLGGMPSEWRRRTSIDVYRAARMTICVSERVQHLLREGLDGDVQSTVVYNGTDTDLFSPLTGEEDPLGDNQILIVGALKANKGHDLALRAIGLIAASFPKLHCRIIGDGPDRTQLESLARELKIAGRVSFEGSKGRAEVSAAMQKCSVFVLPSRYEGLGCVYLEAMACGKPVIACRGQGIDEIVKHQENGWLIPVDGLEELAQGISTLLRAPDLRARLGASARATILNGLTLSDQARRLAEIYGDAISGGRQPS